MEDTQLDRREADALIRALVLFAGGKVTLSPADLERASKGYDLRITGDDLNNQLIVEIVER